jgi:hypothetical protein
MATFDDWMDVYEQFYDAAPIEPHVACPECGSYRLHLVYTGDLDRDVGYGLFWCDACLLGVSICRAVIPDGAVVRDIRLPSEERFPQVPNFRLVPMMSPGR